MRVVYFFALLCLTCYSTSNAQSSETFTKEVSLVVDNDYPFQTDQYYTAGQDLSYRFIISSKNFLNNTDSSKTILTFRYGNKIFTPKNLDTKDISKMDRPYCGWAFVTTDILNFRKKNSANFFSVQLGVVGKLSGMYKAQLWLHKVLDLYSVYGWDAQIVNEFVINLNYNHTHSLPISKKAELVTSSGIWIGTGSNKVSQEFTLRLFKFNSLNKSSYMNSLISKSSFTQKNETFMYVSVETDYVLSNIFIQGSLFNNPSPFTTGINNFLFMPKIGVQFSGKRISANIGVTHISKETPFVDLQNYFTTSMAYRF